MLRLLMIGTVLLGTYGFVLAQEKCPAVAVVTRSVVPKDGDTVIYDVVLKGGAVVDPDLRFQMDRTPGA